MTRPTLLASEGWRPVPGKPLRCTCPACGVELSSNAFARKMHKDKCAKWSTSNVAGTNPLPARLEVPAKQSPVVRPGRVAAVIATNDSARNPAAPPPLPRLRWTSCRVAGVEEWSSWVGGDGPPLVALRVRRVGMKAEQRFEAYAGRRYAGSQATAEAAMSAAERFHDEGEGR